MFKTITAKYPGTCKRCHQPIEPGQRIRFGGRGRTYHLAAHCETLPLPDDGPDNGAPYQDDRDSADHAPDPEPVHVPEPAPVAVAELRF